MTEVDVRTKKVKTLPFSAFADQWLEDCKSAPPNIPILQDEWINALTTNTLGARIEGSFELGPNCTIVDFYTKSKKVTPNFLIQAKPEDGKYAIQVLTNFNRRNSNTLLGTVFRAQVNFRQYHEKEKCPSIVFPEDLFFYILICFPGGVTHADTSVRMFMREFFRCLSKMDVLLRPGVSK